MPEYCEPCPENSEIVIMKNSLSVCYTQTFGETCQNITGFFVRIDDILFLAKQSMKISLQKNRK
jgi:hypothetical protein